MSVGGDTPDWIDTFGHRYFPSPGVALARQFGAALGKRARYDKPGAIARMAMHAASSVDLAKPKRAAQRQCGSDWREQWRDGHDQTHL